MKLTVLYFASLRERLDCPMERGDFPSSLATVADLVGHLRGRGGAWSESFADGKPWRISVNQRMASAGSPIAEGDEIAFFPPVTGG